MEPTKLIETSCPRHGPQKPEEAIRFLTFPPQDKPSSPRIKAQVARDSLKGLCMIQSLGLGFRVLHMVIHGSGVAFLTNPKGSKYANGTYFGA